MSYHMYYSQSQSLNTGVNQPVPTISSLAAYNNVPVSIQTGVPNISYNLVNVPTRNNNVNINFSLSYHPGNVTTDLWAGDLGAGWALLGQGVISREIYQDPDESFDDDTKTIYIKNEYNDIYNYSIPGESGKFRFVRDTINNTNTFRLVKLTATTSKIDYHRNSNQSTLILDSFTITKDNGIKYKFETYNLSTATVWRWSYPWLNDMYGPLKYRSAFFLTSIEDANNQELVKFSYFRDLAYVIGSGQTVTESESNKLNRVEIKDRAIIEIQYQEKPYQTPYKSDKYNLKNLTLKNINNQFISKYNFDVDGPLKSYTKVDASENVLEKTKFNYTSVGLAPTYFPVESGLENVYGRPLLNRVTLPTGGTVEYNFEFAPYSSYSVEVTNTIPAPVQDVGTVLFTQFGGTRKHFFTLTENTDVHINIPNGTLSNFLWTLVFYKKVGSTYQTTPYSLGNSYSQDPGNYPDEQTISFPPGEYYVALSALPPGGSIPEIAFTAYKTIGEPTTTTTTEWRSYHEGLARIKNIKYYNNSDMNLQNPAKTEEFDYRQFANPNLSSEVYIEDGILPDGLSAANPVLLYQSVKVSGSTEGYTKYYFKTPKDFPGYYESYSIRPHYIFSREGILYKKEAYSSTDQKIVEDNYDYTFEEYGEPYPIFNAGPDNTSYTKASWLKNEKIKSKTFYNNIPVETSTEVARNSNNHQVNLEKVTSSDGNVKETSYKYALDKNNQRLINAYMTGVPLEVERKNNGKIVAKAETKYEYPVLIEPSAQVNVNPNDNSQNNLTTYDAYDSFGNLVQYTASVDNNSNGNSTVVIWGYNQTMPIAKIEGAKLSDIGTLAADIVLKSNADINVSTETLLINALDSFRAHDSLKNFQITTYTYDPLVGITTLTPPNGMRVIYRYDTNNRLKAIVDVNGNIVKDYKYNIVAQP